MYQHIRVCPPLDLALITLVKLLHGTLKGACDAAALVYAARDFISDQWAAIIPSLPSLGPISWSLTGLAWPWWGRGGEGYSGLPMADTELYGSGAGGGGAPAAAPYTTPERAHLLQDPQLFPSGP